MKPIIANRWADHLDLNGMARWLEIAVPTVRLWIAEGKLPKPERTGTKLTWNLRYMVGVAKQGIAFRLDPFKPAPRFMLPPIAAMSSDEASRYLRHLDQLAMHLDDVAKHDLTRQEYEKAEKESRIRRARYARTLTGVRKED